MCVRRHGVGCVHYLWGMCGVCEVGLGGGGSVCVVGARCGKRSEQGTLEIDTSKALHTAQPGKRQVTTGRCGTNFF